MTCTCSSEKIEALGSCVCLRLFSLDFFFLPKTVSLEMVSECSVLKKEKGRTESISLFTLSPHLMFGPVVPLPLSPPTAMSMRKRPPSFSGIVQQITSRYVDSHPHVAILVMCSLHKLYQTSQDGSCTSFYEQARTL